ncbi:MAG: TonB-dependent receptor [Acidobacteriota bacterium]
MSNKKSYANKILGQLCPLLLFVVATFQAEAQVNRIAASPKSGTIAGTIVDAQTGRPVVGATILVDGKVKTQSLSDSDGRFAIPIEVGNHAVKYTAEHYTSEEISSVVVTASKVTEASMLLGSDQIEKVMINVDVTASVDAASSTAEVMLVERKLAAVVSDSIGHQELSQGAASDAAASLTKVTGISIVGDGFVYVRGLGERYSATQLNGAVVPTTEPEKRVVPLDLFPSGMLDSITIAKSYSADQPAEFSGGLVQLQTKEYPPSRTLSISANTAFNSATSFNPFLSSPGQSGDFFGFGAGARAIPSIIPANQRLAQGSITSAQAQTYGRAFAPVWEPTQVDSQRPAVGWSANGGTTFGKFGLVAALTFNSKPQYQKEVQRYIRQGNNAPIIFTEYPDFEEYSENARLGGVVNLAYKISQNHKLVYRNTWTHDAEKTSRQFSGEDGTLGTPIMSQRLRYIQRNVYSTSVAGDHTLPNYLGSLIHWQFTYSLSGRNEPDLREVFRIVQPNGLTPFSAASGSATRFFSNMNDHIYEPQADYRVPFVKGQVVGLLKIGVRSTNRRRDFQARRFRYIPQQLSTLNLLLPSDQLLGIDNIRPSGFELVEFTRGTDTYNAGMDVYAGYAMIDLSFGPKLRVIGGVRIEDATQKVVTVDTQIAFATPKTALLHNTDPAPSLNVVYALTSRQNLRASYSRTLSRPDFRELSPFDFTNVLGGFVTTGNENLRRASIQNYDFRWELFPGGNQLIAASVFAKTFKDPIEQTVIVSNDLRQSFVNAKGARNFGIELEFRQDLGNLRPALREFSLGSNFTYVDSSVEIQPENATLLTSRIRPLVGQSRYVFNGNVQWVRPRLHSEARLMSNFVSRRITDLGTYGVPDIYQEPNVSLDAVYQYTSGERGQWSYRFEAENLSNNNFHWTQGPFTQRQYQLGRTFQIGVTYSIF